MNKRIQLYSIKQMNEPFCGHSTKLHQMLSELKNAEKQETQEPSEREKKLLQNIKELRKNLEKIRKQIKQNRKK